MAYFGEVERRNLHGLICIPVLPKSLAGMTYFFHLFIFYDSPMVHHKLGQLY